MHKVISAESILSKYEKVNNVKLPKDQKIWLIEAMEEYADNFCEFVLKLKTKNKAKIKPATSKKIKSEYLFQL